MVRLRHRRKSEIVCSRIIRFASCYSWYNRQILPLWSGTPFGHDQRQGKVRDLLPGSETGLDYADQRYHQVGMGRFMTADPYMASGGPNDPGSWNRYAYAEGDPANNSDPHGLYIATDAYGDYGGSCYEWPSKGSRHFTRSNSWRYVETRRGGE